MTAESTPWIHGLSARMMLALLLVSALVALGVGFLWVSPELGGQAITHWGYYYILALFLYGIFLGAVDLRRDERPWRLRLTRNRSLLCFLLFATALATWSDEFGHKLLFDDYVLQGTAYHMHATKEVATPLRAYEFAGTWIDINTFLDKRPYFFPFLVSLLHDATGFRVTNVYILNVVLAFVVLGGVCWLVLRLTGSRAASITAVCLLTTVPLFGQYVTGASMELANLAMIIVTLAAVVRYLQRPDAVKLSLVVVTTILLALTRYESVLFVIPTAGAIVYSWFRERRIVLSWGTIAAPLLLVPYAWHDRYVGSHQYLWQLREGEQTRFGAEYLASNLEGARHFLFNLSPVHPNSLCVVVIGGIGVVFGLARILRFPSRLAVSSRWAAALGIFLFGLTIVANLGLLMFYYWSRLDDAAAARFALPLFLLLVIAAGWFVHFLERRSIPGLKIAACGLGVWLLVIGAPAYAQRLYTTRNPVRHELAWELEQAKSRHYPVFFITSKATLPFLLEKIPTLNTNIAVHRAAEIAWHMKEGTFHEVLVAQVIRPTTEEGVPVVDPEERLPSSFQLETLEVKRFGARWIRISRVKNIQVDRF